MNNRLKLITGLSIFSALLSVYFIDEHFVRQQKHADEVNSVALYFENKDCTKFVLNNQNGSFAFERKDFADLWYMTSPKRVLADQDAVNSMLVLLRNISIQRKVSSDNDNSEFGLETPIVSFGLTFNDQTQKTIEFGDTITTSGQFGFNLPSAYAKTSDNESILVVDNSSLSSFIEKDFSLLRTKEIANFKLKDVSSFEIIEHNKKSQNSNFNNANLIKLAKKEKNNWMIQSPSAIEADDSFIIQYLQMLQSLMADLVVEPPFDEIVKIFKINLNRPAATISLKTDKQNEIQSINLCMGKSELFVQMPDGALAQFTLDEWSNLIPTFKQFRNRSVFLNTKCASKISTLTALDIIDDASDSDLAKFGLTDPIKVLDCEPNLVKKKSSQPQILIGNRVPLDEKSVYLKRSDSNRVYIVDTKLLSALAE